MIALKCAYCGKIIRHKQGARLEYDSFGINIKRAWCNTCNIEGRYIDRPSNKPWPFKTPNGGGEGEDS